MNLHLIVIGAVALVSVASASKDETPKKDVEAIQGTWSVFSIEEAGKEPPKLEGLEMTFTADKVRFNLPAGGGRPQSYKLDPSKKPKALDLDKVPAIYELDGDNLKICVGEAGQERPAAFTTKSGTGKMLFVLKRKKQ
jgi:uncharacterized protein (TIGR03067 family)